MCGIRRAWPVPPCARAQAATAPCAAEFVQVIPRRRPPPSVAAQASGRKHELPSGSCAAGEWQILPPTRLVQRARPSARWRRGGDATRRGRPVSQADWRPPPESGRRQSPARLPPSAFWLPLGSAVVLSRLADVATGGWARRRAVRAVVTASNVAPLARPQRPGLSEAAWRPRPRRSREHGADLSIRPVVLR